MNLNLDALVIDIDGQVTYSGSYFSQGELESESYVVEIYQISPTPKLIIGASYGDSVTINQIIARRIPALGSGFGSAGIELVTETFPAFTIARDDDNGATTQNLIDALIENIGISRNWSVNTTTTNSNVNLNNTELPPFFFGPDGDDLQSGFQSILHSVIDSDNIILDFYNTNESDEIRFRLHIFDMNTDRLNAIRIDSVNIGGNANQNETILTFTEPSEPRWENEIITSTTPRSFPINQALFSNRPYSSESDSDKVFIEAIAAGANSVADGSIDSDAINNDLLVRLLDHISDSEVIAAVESYDSDLKINIEGQVTYTSSYTVGILTGTESDYTTTTYEIVDSPVALIDSGHDSVTFDRIEIELVGGGTEYLVEVSVDSEMLTIVRSPNNNAAMAQDLIDALVKGWPGDRDFNSSIISVNSNIDLDASSLPPFYFEKDSDDNLRVAIGPELRSALGSSNFEISFRNGVQNRFQLRRFDVNDQTDTAANLATNLVGENGAFLDRSGNWVTESVTVDGPQDFTINRVLFSNDSDEEGEVYINAVAKIADGSIDSDAIDDLLLLKILENTQRTNNEIISVIRNDSDLDLSDNVIEGKHIASMSIESEHIESEFLSRLLTPAEAESVADGAIDSDAIESGLLSRLLANEDTQHEESEVIRIADSVDIDFGSVDVMDTANYILILHTNNSRLRSRWHNKSSGWLRFRFDMKDI